ncbi:ImmA/IrrE family metallo-endopeptidase [Nocardioides sp. SOB77]|uniref:ImmA/IrrE family metallo-endopeptidase n=1 Tax=Nocardioides oceani TaxID=3058369 RepID=A0ABT8FLR6_9ACTN|nr:ImmA/IrrE family metallo-endopeptidase [Nocardioides oceani]MDN4175621.1 ImmA/IrrE family metallo-endopeptidase [Nocardioides oceani]
MNRISDATTELLRATGQTQPPVDLTVITDYLDLTVVKTNMSNDVSGMLIRDGASGANTVGLNNAHNLGRRRFTLAHEIGHFHLHRGRPLIVDSSVRINLRDRTSGMATDREEMEANRFAAELLMPSEVVLDAVAAAKMTDADQLTHHLATRFKVSQQAMGYRLINLGILSSPS